MQDRYTGDVGDFGKYRLLRHLCGHLSDTQALRLGIVWYLAPDETHNKDGGHTEYLDKSAKNDRMFRACDPELYDTLSRIVSEKENGRRVARVQEAPIFAQDTVFYDAPLTFAGMPGNSPAARRARLAHRQAWVRGAFEATASCDIIFVDPDNGLEVKTSRHVKPGLKYAYFDELAPYTARGQSLVIYQHFAHHIAHKEQIAHQLERLRQQFPERSPFALRFRPYSPRAFLVVPAPAHGELLRGRAKAFLQTPWGSGKEPHFAIHWGT